MCESSSDFVWPESRCSELWAGPKGSEPGACLAGRIRKQCPWSCSPSGLLHRNLRGPAAARQLYIPGCRKEFHPGLTSSFPSTEGRDEGRGDVLCWAMKCRQRLCWRRLRQVIWVFRCFYMFSCKDAAVTSPSVVVWWSARSSWWGPKERDVPGCAGPGRKNNFSIQGLIIFSFFLFLWIFLWLPVAVVGYSECFPTKE